MDSGGEAAAERGKGRVTRQQSCAPYCTGGLLEQCLAEPSAPFLPSSRKRGQEGGSPRRIAAVAVLAAAAPATRRRQPAAAGVSRCRLAAQQAQRAWRALRAGGVAGGVVGVAAGAFSGARRPRRARRSRRVRGAWSAAVRPARSRSLASNALTQPSWPQRMAAISGVSPFCRERRAATRQGSALQQLYYRLPAEHYKGSLAPTGHRRPKGTASS